MMTGRERYMTVYRGEIPDRPPVKLWKLFPGQHLSNPAYRPVYQRGLEVTDLVARMPIVFDHFFGRHRDQITTQGERSTSSPEWRERITTVATPAGVLESVYTSSTCGKPGYVKEYLIKGCRDVEKLLSVPHEPIPFDTKPYYDMDRLVGEKGITNIELGSPMAALQAIAGTENFALMSVDCRPLLLEALSVLAKRKRDLINAVFDSGLKPVFFSWGGADKCIPPLMSMRDFDEFVVPFDKPLIELIHERGGYVLANCLGKVRSALRRFVDMGVDVLNPLEPPPMGDITLPEAFDLCGDAMGLEGNIPMHDLMTAEPDHIASLVRDALSTGTGRRFVLCTGYAWSYWPEPSDRLIQNLLVFIEEGIREL